MGASAMENPPGGRAASLPGLGVGGRSGGKGDRLYVDAHLI
jgi:hypothetical protein